MSEDTAIKRTSVKHAYQQVADAVAARIASGRYSCKLPGELDLAREFGVSYTTLRHAMAILRERDLIVSIHGRGTFAAPEPAGNRPQAASNDQDLA
jgi:GntR family transcriptional regulator